MKTLMGVVAADIGLLALASFLGRKKPSWQVIDEPFQPEPFTFYCLFTYTVERGLVPGDIEATVWGWNETWKYYDTLMPCRVRRDPTVYVFPSNMTEKEMEEFGWEPPWPKPTAVFASSIAGGALANFGFPATPEVEYCVMIDGSPPGPKTWPSHGVYGQASISAWGDNVIGCLLGDVERGENFSNPQASILWNRYAGVQEMIHEVGHALWPQLGEPLSGYLSAWVEDSEVVYGPVRPEPIDERFCMTGWSRTPT